MTDNPPLIDVIIETDTESEGHTGTPSEDQNYESHAPDIFNSDDELMDSAQSNENTENSGMIDIDINSEDNNEEIQVQQNGDSDSDQVFRRGGILTLRKRSRYDNIEGYSKRIANSLFSNCIVNVHGVIVPNTKDLRIKTFSKIEFVKVETDIISNLCYPCDYRLVSLKTIVDENFNDDIRLAECVSGTILKELSALNHEAFHISYIKKINNKFDGIKYRLLYGVVHEEYFDCVLHLLNLFCTISGKKPETCISEAKRKRRMVSKSYFENNRDPVILYDGDIELLVYIYCNWSSRDLIRLQSNVKSSKAKCLLQQACTFIADAELRQHIVNYADFSNEDCITKACLLEIKNLFTNIIDSLETEFDLGVELWFNFMQIVDIHHYLSPHTISEMLKHLPLMKTRLDFRLEEENALVGKTRGHILTVENVYELLKNWIPSAKCVERCVVNSINDLFIWVASCFGYHLRQMGITPVDWKIHKRLVEGFANFHVDKFGGNVDVPLGDVSTIAVSRRVVEFVANAAQHETRNFRIDDEAINAIMKLIHHVTGRAIYPAVVNTERQPNVNTSIRQYMIAHAVKTYLHVHSTGIFPDLWPNDSDTDDDDPEVLDDLATPFNSQVLKNFFGVNDDLITLSDETEYLLREYRKNQDQMLQDGVLNSPVRCTRNFQNTGESSKHKTPANEKFKPLNETFRRTNCVLCSRKSTSLRLNLIKGEMSIAACMNCINLLNQYKIDHEILIERVNHQVRAPICWDAEFQLIEGSPEDLPRTRVTYNWDLRARRRAINEKKSRLRGERRGKKIFITVGCNGEVE
ncbi:GbNV_gp28-like-2 [Fopius arisanus]|nr:GbNV_gp28-like-2 [Fopius arisanus]